MFIVYTKKTNLSSGSAQILTNTIKCAIILKNAEVIKMSDKELLTILIDSYANLRRIIESGDPKEEAEYQIKLITAKLESMGIVTTDLDRTPRNEK